MWLDEADLIPHAEYVETNRMPPHEPFSEWQEGLRKHGGDSRYEFVFRGVVDIPGRRAASP